MASVYEMMRLMGKDGVDVYDDVYGDEGACWDAWEDGPRPIGAVFRYVMEHTELSKGVDGPYGVHFVAKVSEFVRREMGVLGPFSRVWNDPWYQIDGSEDGIESGISTVHSLMIGGYPEEAYEELAEAWGVARMDAHFDESLVRAQEALDEASGLLRAQGLDSLADRLDDAWCAVRDVKAALRDPEARIIVLEAWRCTSCSPAPSGWGSAPSRRP